jgi:hypothetical protein
MKEYLFKFRGQAFDGAFALFKRTVLPNFILRIIMSIISMAILVPLLLATFGWTLRDFMNFGEKMREASQAAASGEDFMDVFGNMFGSPNFLYLLLTIIVGLIIYCWMFYAYFRLNDNEVRSRNNSFISALGSSFSGKIFSILGYYVLYFILYMIIAFIFIFLIAIIMNASQAAGILIGFLGSFLVIFFLMRFSIGGAAIVHGNLSIGEAISYSYRHITWKRSALIFLILLIVLIVFFLLSYLISLITFSIVDKGADSVTALVVTQIFSSITSSIIGAFIYASMTTLYFRYSTEAVEDEDVKEHLVV